MRLFSPPKHATGSAHRGRELGLLLPTSAALALAGGLLRAAAVPPTVADVDGVNFARALDAFDPAHQAPHFPGYPVYVALSSIAHALGAPEVWALALPSILLWPIAAFVLALGALRAWGRGAALGALITASLAPGAITLGGWPGSDGLGFALLALGLGALACARVDGGAALDRGVLAVFGSASASRWAITGGAALGLLLGVRLTWWPVVAGALVVARVRRALVAALVAVLAWAAPLAVIVGPRDLVALGLGFTGGHFESWGNTAMTSDVGVLARVARAAWDVVAAGLGGVWLGAVPSSSGGLEEVHGAAWIISGVAGLGLGAFALRRRAALEALDEIVIVALAYLAWVLVAQNVDKPRHLLPLLPIVGAMIGAGWSRLFGGLRSAGAVSGVGAARAAITVGAAVALTTVSLARAEVQRTTLAPQAAVVADVARRAPAGLAIFAGEESRVFEHLAPMYRVMRPASPDVLTSEVARLTSLGVDVLVTSGAPGASALSLEPVSVHQTLEVLRGPESFVVLHRVRPAAPLARGPQEVIR
ncbi:hypothetical protein L6R52_08600 [Myxococcota bacterium]|nr:hypothetical protein [Myxococcota bacterium]